MRNHTLSQKLSVTFCIISFLQPMSAGAQFSGRNSSDICILKYKSVIEQLIKSETEAAATDDINISMDIPGEVKTVLQGDTTVLIPFYGMNVSSPQSHMSGHLLLKFSFKESQFKGCALKQILLD